MVGEYDSRPTETLDYATKEEPSPFDAMLPTQPTQTVVYSKKIIAQTIAGTKYTIELHRPNVYHNALFKATADAISTDWFTNEIKEKSRYTYTRTIRNFFNWINHTNYDSTSKNRYRCLKDYESHRTNVLRNKTTPLTHINNILTRGLVSPFLSEHEHRYLSKLIKLSKPMKKSEPVPFTLTDWFSLPWLRPLLGDRAYLQLESARRLLLSFRITTAITLLYFLEVRQQWQMLNTLEFKTTYRNWYRDWNRILLQTLGKFDEQAEPMDSLSELLVYDLIKPHNHPTVKEKLKEPGEKELKKTYTCQDKCIYPWQRPVFFHPDYQKKYSPIEERLLAWLLACEAIQPNDIQKLKTTDYAQEFNASGQLIEMECSYYKGRAGAIRQPAILLASEPWTQALHLYIQRFPNSSPLFQSKVVRQFSMPGLDKHSDNNNMINLLLRVWKSPTLQKRINSELKRLQASPMFLDTMFSLEKGGESYQQFLKRTSKGVADYRELISRPLPTHIFSLTHIKNTAVHAGSDNYREADLINHHSHTSESEKHNYMTDQNKEFVNRAGRVTRLVLHDLQNVVYQPSITAVEKEVRDRELHTRIIDATGDSNTILFSFDQPLKQDDEESEIIVPDTTDTAIYFIHFLTQAELVLPELVAVRPDWVERTLLIRVEWIARTLTRMQKAKTAQEQYSKLQDHLPPLFDHLLETIE